MMAKKGSLLKALGLIFVANVVMVLDVYLWLAPPEGDTISEMGYRLASSHPGMLALVFFTLGHFLWPLKPKEA